MRMKAQALALSGRRSEALRVIRSALTLAPTDEKALDQYLSYAVDAKDIVAAVEIATRAVAVNPWSSLFHERLAHFSLERADYCGISPRVTGRTAAQSVSSIRAHVHDPKPAEAARNQSRGCGV